jgi:hypothetical protein
MDIFIYNGNSKTYMQMMNDKTRTVGTSQGKGIRSVRAILRLPQYI